MLFDIMALQAIKWLNASVGILYLSLNTLKRHKGTIYVVCHFVRHILEGVFIFCVSISWIVLTMQLKYMLC